ncbi:glycine zipper 2TM domain-containing protein [Sphingopyxis sp. XHP0097]|uniref:17 kDa surface antigen n=1 Tax=Sphingopyxis jiangsuensis TaxID=2871171 RepID=A0ABS7MBQ7_9SPHN|nr:glycine zipper 2TM domain-containing protein [Sphingopyxis jiangsuensis]MBY4636242.1 glycine zipper 2TM domain-containing protein [Sphingopyxis jiangsuensis]
MRILTKGLLGGIAAAGIALTAPAYAGTAAPAKTGGYYELDQSAGFHKRKKRHSHYARDQRINRDTRIWRGNDGRYRCRRDDGTTGLLIGGAVGGLAGHEIAGDGDKLLGTIIGAGAGALIGREIDRDKYRCR